MLSGKTSSFYSILHSLSQLPSSLTSRYVNRCLFLLFSKLDNAIFTEFLVKPVRNFNKFCIDKWKEILYICMHRIRTVMQNFTFSQPALS